MKSRLCIVHFDEDGEPMSYEAPDEPVVFRWKRDYWSDWNPLPYEKQLHASIKEHGYPIEYAYSEKVKQR
jgi:hypothetical protein